MFASNPLLLLSSGAVEFLCSDNLGALRVTVSILHYLCLKYKYSNGGSKIFLIDTITILHTKVAVQLINSDLLLVTFLHPWRLWITPRVFWTTG